MAIDRLCLLLGRGSLRPWLKEALLRVERETDAAVSLIVRTDTDGTTPADPLKHPFDADVRHVQTLPVDEGPGVELPDSTVETITTEADVAVQNGVGILTGDILTEPEYGVLSYHHGDIRRYRGVITHFWNYLNGDDTAGVTLLQLSEQLDAGGIAAEADVDLSGCHRWSEVEARKQIAGIPLLQRAVENFDDPTFTPETVPPEELGRMYYSSDVTLPVIGRYLMLESARTAHDTITNLRYLLDIYRNS
jgi:folate-dependent phosphoribosylglycinamide formyltransferase PurN